MSTITDTVTVAACITPLPSNPWFDCAQLGGAAIASADGCHLLKPTVAGSCGPALSPVSVNTPVYFNTQSCPYGTNVYFVCTSSVSIVAFTSMTSNGIKPTSKLTSATSMNISVFSTTLSSTGSSAPYQKSSKDKVSSGAVAGIGIGCAIIGAILAGVAVFFFFRRNRGGPSYQQQQPAKMPARYSAIEKGFITVNTTAENNGVARHIDSLLPQPAEDGAIAGGVLRIRDSIKNHVQNYYHGSITVSSEMVDDTSLSGLANATSRSTSNIRDLLLNPVTRMATIRSLLAYLVLSSCLGQPDAANSVLPKEISAFTSLQAKDDETNASQAALFSKWKVVSGALLQKQYGEYDRGNDPRNSSIIMVVDIADSVLRPFISPGIDEDARRRNLKSIVGRVAQFAFLVFAQPSSFRFDFTTTGQPDTLVVFPAMMQIVDDEAQILAPPRAFTEKETVSIRT